MRSYFISKAHRKFYAQSVLFVCVLFSTVQPALAQSTLEKPFLYAVLRNGEYAATAVPTYRWKTVPGATFYQLFVSDSAGTRIETWYNSLDAGCNAGEAACSIRPTTALRIGAVKWWVRAWNPSNYGPWSDAGEFKVTSDSGPETAVYHKHIFENIGSGFLQSGPSLTVEGSCDFVDDRPLAASCLVEAEFGQPDSTIDFVLQGSRYDYLNDNFVCEFRCEPTLSGKNSTAACSAATLNIWVTCARGVR